MGLVLDVFLFQLLQFQQKRHGKKKKKKKAGDGSVSVTSGASEEQRLESGNLDDLGDAPDALHKRLKKAEEGEEVSQADTDHDAPSIASEPGSPIPFDVSDPARFSLLLCGAVKRVKDQHVTVVSQRSCYCETLLFCKAAMLFCQLFVYPIV